MVLLLSLLLLAQRDGACVLRPDAKSDITVDTDAVPQHLRMRMLAHMCMFHLVQLGVFTLSGAADRHGVDL